MLPYITSAQILGTQLKQRIQTYTLTYTQLCKMKPEVHHSWLYIIEVRILPNKIKCISLLSESELQPL